MNEKEKRKERRKDGLILQLMILPGNVGVYLYGTNQISFLHGSLSSQWHMS